MAELVDVLVLIVRGALIAGLAWGAWLSLGLSARPRGAPRELRLERIAQLALLVLLLTTIGAFFHAG